MYYDILHDRRAKTPSDPRAVIAVVMLGCTSKTDVLRPTDEGDVVPTRKYIMRGNGDCYNIII